MQMDTREIGHTPLPWFARSACTPTDGELDTAICAYVENEPVVIGECFGRVFESVRPDSSANAELIIRAVNAYPALVEALEYCQRMFRLDLYREIDSDGPDFNQAIFDTSARVDAALALSARGDGS